MITSHLTNIDNILKNKKILWIYDKIYKNTFHLLELEQIQIIYSIVLKWYVDWFIFSSLGYNLIFITDFDPLQYGQLLIILLIYWSYNHDLLSIFEYFSSLPTLPCSPHLDALYFLWLILFPILASILWVVISYFQNRGYSVWFYICLCYCSQQFTILFCWCYL